MAGGDALSDPVELISRGGGGGGAGVELCCGRQYDFRLVQDGGSSAPRGENL